MILKALPVVMMAACSTLPSYDDPRTRNIEPGEYEVHYKWVLYETQEEATKRCNSGISGGKRLSCTFSNASPLPIIVTHMPKNANDWTPMCYLGHESMHIPFGDWHLQRGGR